MLLLLLVAPAVSIHPPASAPEEILDLLDDVTIDESDFEEALIDHRVDQTEIPTIADELFDRATSRRNRSEAIVLALSLSTSYQLRYPLRRVGYVFFATLSVGLEQLFDPAPQVSPSRLERVRWRRCLGLSAVLKEPLEAMKARARFLALGCGEPRW